MSILKEKKIGKKKLTQLTFLSIEGPLAIHAFVVKPAIDACGVIRARARLQTTSTTIGQAGDQFLIAAKLKLVRIRVDLVPIVHTLVQNCIVEREVANAEVTQIVIVLEELLLARCPQRRLERIQILVEQVVGLAERERGRRQLLYHRNELTRLGQVTERVDIYQVELFAHGELDLPHRVAYLVGVLVEHHYVKCVP
jgi:hypothetical protein